MNKSFFFLAITNNPKFFFFFFLMMRRPPRSTFFPSTTLFRSIRRMNPRDTAANMNRRRMIRRGATYGSYLPEGTPDDGTERGIAAFVICASLIRQFEFAQKDRKSVV